MLRIGPLNQVAPKPSVFHQRRTDIDNNLINTLIWNGNGRGWEQTHGNGMGIGHKIGNKNGGMGM